MVNKIEVSKNKKKVLFFFFYLYYYYYIKLVGIRQFQNVIIFVYNKYT